MNLRYALTNMTSAHPLKTRGLVITLHIHRGRHSVNRYYRIESEHGCWNSAMYTSAYAHQRDLLDDFDPIGDHRAVVQEVMRCIETEAYKRQSVKIKPEALKLSAYCQHCGASIAHMRLGTRFCNEAHRRQYRRRSNREAQAS